MNPDISLSTGELSEIIDQLREAGTPQSVQLADQLIEHRRRATRPMLSEIPNHELAGLAGAPGRTASGKFFIYVEPIFDEQTGSELLRHRVISTADSTVFAIDPPRSTSTQMFLDCEPAWSDGVPTSLAGAEVGE